MLEFGPIIFSHPDRMGSAKPIADGMSKVYVIGVWVELCEHIHRVLSFSID